MKVNVTYTPDYEAWKELDYLPESETVRGTFYQWHMSNQLNNGFAEYTITIDFDVEKGPESIRIFKGYDSYIDSWDMVDSEDPKEIELMKKERERVEAFFDSLK